MKKVKYILQVKDSDFTKESDSFEKLVDYGIYNNLFTQEDKTIALFNTLIDNYPNWVRDRELEREPGNSSTEIYTMDFEKVILIKKIMEG